MKYNKTKKNQLNLRKKLNQIKLNRAQLKPN